MAASSEFMLAMKRMQECNVIKYAAYRTAAKLRVLQRSFYVDKLTLKVVSGLFERHKLQKTENSVQLVADELEPVLADIFFVLQREFLFDLEPEQAAQQLSDFMFRVFDRSKSGAIQVLSAKLGLVLLCSAKPREKYQYLFNQLADHNNCLSRKKLEILLKKIILMTEFLSEGLSFGADLISGTVESCFKHNTGNLGITEDVFTAWLLQDPQLLVWISTLYRMQLSEIVCHATKCAVCKMYPIVGLRYRCLRCLSYNQCQACFFMGKHSKKHKLKHPVQEYCCQTTSRQSTKALLLTLCNKLRKTSSKLQYLPAQKPDPALQCEQLGESTRLLDELELSSKTVLHGSRVALQPSHPLHANRELQSVIQHLEQENRQLSLEIESLLAEGDKARFKECLMDHRAQVETQVQRLKVLKSYMGTQRLTEGRSQYQSTPLVLPFKRQLKKVDVHEFSPIARQRESAPSLVWDQYDIGIHEETPVVRQQPLDMESTSESLGERTEAPSLSTLLGGSALLPIDETTYSWLHADKGANKENKPEVSNQDKKALEDLHADLDDVLTKLQKFLSTSTQAAPPQGEENGHLELAATEMESLLTGIIQGIEHTAVI